MLLFALCAPMLAVGQTATPDCTESPHARILYAPEPNLERSELENDKGDYENRTEWHRVYAWSNLSKFARTLQKGQLITLEGKLKYREIEEDLEGVTFKHRIAEIHAISMKRLSKIEAADDPSDGADDE